MSTPLPATARATVAWVMLAAFSLLLGCVLARGLAFHQPRDAVLPWGDARWIGLGPANEMLYLRRDVVLGTRASSARLMVAATDHFQVYVNGKLVGTEDYLGARPSAVYDLTRLLTPGINTLAILVGKSAKRTQAQALASLEWREGAGLNRLVSDGSWRAESRRHVSQGGLLDWNAPAFPDATWRNAQIVDEPPVADVPQPDSLAHEVLEPPPQARWIWHRNPQSGVGAFSRDLQLDAASAEAGWLGVSVDGVYTVAVNGFSLGASVGGVNRMDVLDIGPYLRRGANRVEIQISGGSPPMRLAAFGRVLTSAGSVDFSSDERWHDSPGGTPAAVLSDFSSMRPALTATPMAPPQAWERWQTTRWLGLSTLVFALLLALGIALTRRQDPAARAQAWMRHAQPWAAAAMLLGLALLADLDPRVSMAPTYSFWLPAVALLLAALLASLLARGFAASQDPA